MNQIERGFEAFRKEAGERIAQLEAENAELRAKISELEKAFAPNFVDELHVECLKFERDNAKLLKDKERLDFINANHLVQFGHSSKMGGHGPGWYWVLGTVASHYRIKNIRDTIDSAIAWHKKPRGPKQNIHTQEAKP
jgi:hypothetical protein